MAAVSQLVLRRVSRVVLTCRPSQLAQFSAAPAAAASNPVYQASDLSRHQALMNKYARSQWDFSVDESDALVQRLAEDLQKGSRAALAEAITLVENRHPTKRARGDALVSLVLGQARRRLEQRGPHSLIFRIAISGAPGVGKSSFIETLGQQLINEHNKKVAVLTVDPSSQRTGGSILGDITRMNDLQRNPRAFIRQSPSHGTLGGVTRGTHEAIILCEGAGYDVVLIETVGVGQSEVSVAEMVDLFCLLVSPAAGDELQAVKRGVMEISELVVVTKADGDLHANAFHAQAEYTSALKYFRPRTPVWSPRVLHASAVTKAGMADVWAAMDDFWRRMSESGELLRRRDDQLRAWMWQHVQDEILHTFRNHPDVMAKEKSVEEDILLGKMTPGYGAEVLLRTFLGV